MVAGKRHINSIRFFIYFEFSFQFVVQLCAASDTVKPDREVNGPMESKIENKGLEKMLKY